MSIINLIVTDVHLVKLCTLASSLRRLAFLSAFLCYDPPCNQKTVDFCPEMCHLAVINFCLKWENMIRNTVVLD